MKKSFALFTLFVLLASNIFAKGLFTRYDEKHFNKAVEKILGHKAEDFEQSIIDITYSYYFKECNEKWDKTTWNYAVEKAAKLCTDKAAVTAAKTGKIGEKVIKALIVAAEDAAGSIKNWINKKSDEYDSRK